MTGADSEQLVALNFRKNIHFVDKGYNELTNQCPQGVIQGMTTEYMTSQALLSWPPHAPLKGHGYAAAREVGKPGKAVSAAVSGKHQGFLYKEDKD
jgi:hypothetical protein